MDAKTENQDQQRCRCACTPPPTAEENAAAARRLAQVAVVIAWFALMATLWSD
jgi:hypothetical protein